MFSNTKKFAAYVLTAIVLCLTVIALLGIWEVISFEYIIRKVLTSLFVVFLSTVIILFIFGVVLRDDEK
ncbi:MAG: hypothetical protein PHT69_00385 [Bacteroidales bacterium]|nr:hypothetical protein [Bacteroidales bacterium]